MIYIIEFNGYITGLAEKYFWKKSRRVARIVFVLATLFFAPIVIIVGLNILGWAIYLWYLALLISIILLSLIPVGKKHKLNFTPKKVFIDDEYIVCVGNKYEEYKLISDIKRVVDYGEFYDVKFRFGKISDKFICQKSLLTKGTLEEFESLFSDKLVRKIK